MAEKVLLGSLEAGGTKMVCATGYADGTIVERGRFDTTTPEETVRACADWFAERGVAALGVGAFGPTAVDPASPRYGQILTTPKLAWRDFDLLGTLKSRFDIPMGYDTDVNIACLGEVTFGCAQGLEDVCYLTIGTGVGAGVMVGGKLIHGMMHPESGHVLLTRDPRDPMPEGESGCPFHANCLEGLIAGPGVAKRWGGVRGERARDRRLRHGPSGRLPRPGPHGLHPLLRAQENHHRAAAWRTTRPSSRWPARRWPSTSTTTW